MKKNPAAGTEPETNKSLTLSKETLEKKSNAGLCDAAKTKITSNFKLLQTKKATSARKFSLSAEIKTFDNEIHHFGFY